MGMKSFQERKNCLNSQMQALFTKSMDNTSFEKLSLEKRKRYFTGLRIMQYIYLPYMTIDSY